MIGTIDPSAAYVAVGFTPVGEYTYRVGQLTHQSYLPAITDAQLPVRFIPYTFPNRTISAAADGIVVAIVALHVFPDT
jgi:hypothetical protein